jgi:nucleotide-binding universal stress UspA family protein
LNTERPVAATALDTLLLPTDGSGCADVAADWAFSIADATGVEVHVLCVDARTYTSSPGSDDPSEAQRRRLEERAKSPVERTVTDHASPGSDSDSDPTR